MRYVGRSAVVLGLAAVVAAGCASTVKTTQKRVVTAEEAAAAERERAAAKAREGEEAGAKPAPVRRRPATLEEEVERLRAEIEREPQNPKHHFLLGMTYERLAENREGPGGAERSRGYLELAELRYRRGAELIPPGEYTGPHFTLGRVLWKQGKWGPALVELKKAVAVKPRDIDGYYLNPDYREAHFLIGTILHRNGELDEAERNFRLYLKYGGDSSRVVDFFPELLAE